MSNPAIPLIHTKDRIINQLQQNLITGIGQVQNQLNNTPSGGIFVTGASLVTGTNVVQHNLGRVPLGWLLTDITSASVIYRGAWTSSNITLNSSAPTTISLFLF